MSTEFILDLTGYKDTVGARVEPGRYRVVVDDAELTKSKAGNPMINLWFRVVGGAFDGATITDRVMLSGKALFRTVAFMQAIGMQTPKKKMALDLRKFLGKVLDVDIDDGEPYNGRVKSEVNGYLRPAGGSSAKSEAPDLDDLHEVEDVEEAPEPVAVEEVATVEEQVIPKTAAATASEPEEIDLETLDLG